MPESLIRETSGRSIPRLALLRTAVGVWLLVLVVAWPVLGITIFDTIQLSRQGYSDQEIIDLIEATNSIFELEADDLPRLKRLGVSEAVIRVMLARVPTEPEGGEAEARPPELDTSRESVLERPEPWDPEPTDDDHADQEHPGREIDSAARIETTLPESRRATEPTSRVRVEDHWTLEREPWALAELLSFSIAPYHEDRSGGHDHLVVRLDRIELLILRDEGRYRSIDARASQVTEQLEAALAAGDGGFFAVPIKAAFEVEFRPASAQPALSVVVANASDAAAYQSRSGRTVSPELLATYWADLLSDFWSIVFGRTPGRLRGVHVGETLGVLHQALWSSGGEAGLWGAAELMPSSEQHHLERLAAAIPVDFSP